MLRRADLSRVLGAPHFWLDDQTGIVKPLDCSVVLCSIDFFLYDFPSDWVLAQLFRAGN